MQITKAKNKTLVNPETEILLPILLIDEQTHSRNNDGQLAGPPSSQRL